MLTFEGGLRDGTRLSSASADPREASEAHTYYRMSAEGEIGRRHWMVSEASIQEMAEILEITPDGPRLARERNYGKRHIYEVVDRAETDDAITVRFRFVETVD